MIGSCAQASALVYFICPGLFCLVQNCSGADAHSLEHPGAASEGCVIMPPFVRGKVWESGDHRLQVVGYPWVCSLGRLSKSSGIEQGQ